MATDVASTEASYKLYVFLSDFCALSFFSIEVYTTLWEFSLITTPTQASQHVSHKQFCLTNAIKSCVLIYGRRYPQRNDRGAGLRLSIDSIKQPNNPERHLRRIRHRLSYGRRPHRLASTAKLQTTRP